MKAIPDIPVTVMAQSQATARRRRARARRCLPSRSISTRRCASAGTTTASACCCRAICRAAEAAFRKVSTMDPGYADGPVNVARALLQEGNVVDAIPWLEQALKIDPQLAKTHYFLGTALKTLGRYDEALRHLREAAAQYPRDRVVLGSDRPRAVPAAAVRRCRGDLQARAAGRPRGSAGPLQPDALLPGARRQRERRARGAALHALQGRRVGAVHHRPLPPEVARRQQRAAADSRAPAGNDEHERRPWRAETAEIAEENLLGVLRDLCVRLAGRARAWPSSPRRRAAGPPLFADVTARAGIKFVHTSGAFGKKYLPETIGSGVVFFDADGDSWQDLLFVNSSRWPGRAGAKTTPALYRNNGDGTFTDVTRGSGLDVEVYGIGATAADFDNDGREDVYVTALGGNRLFRGTGGGRFADVTRTAGVGDGGFSTSALWFDYDHDGRLDLFVSHYVDWSIEKDLFCTLDGKSKSYCTPESYKGHGPALYHNRGNGTFEDVTRQAGLFDTTSKGLGVAMVDYDADGWMDLFVANDTQPNRLYRNKGDGTFSDAGTSAGVAFSEAGVARAGMGVDAADYDGSGRPGIIVGNFSNEMMALYHNEGRGLFIDEAPATVIGRATLLTLTFALLLLRLRPRRPAGHLRRQRARGRRHRARAGSRALRTAPASVSKRRREEVRRGRGRHERADAAARRARRRLCRLRPRRRSRCRGVGQQRRRTSLPERERAGRQRAARADRRRVVESRRHRRACRRLGRGRRADVADREDRVELCVAKRAAADLRPRSARSRRRPSASPGLADGSIRLGQPRRISSSS